MFPPKGRMCHRTGFTQSCFDLVASEKCGRWGKLTTEDEHGTPQDNHMCLDDMEIGLICHLQKKLNNVVGSIDALRSEAKARDVTQIATQTHVLGTVMSAARQIAAVGDALEEVKALEARNEQLALFAPNGRDA